MNKKYISFIFIDFIIVILSFLIAIWPKHGTLHFYLPSYFLMLIYYGINLIFISVILGKYDKKNYIFLRTAIITILKSNLVALGVISLVVIIFKEISVSRLVFFTTIILINVFEIILASFFVLNRRLNKSADFIEKQEKNSNLNFKEGVEGHLQKESYENNNLGAHLHGISTKYFIEEFGENAYSFLIKFIDFNSPENAFFATTTRFNIEKLPNKYFKNIINIKKINNIRLINKFFESVNNKLPLGGLFIGRVETNLQKRKEIFKLYGYFGYIVLFFYFIFKRMLPKMSLTKRFYFYLTNGKERALSKAEALGRLVSCGFKIIEYEEIDNLLYFVVEKVKEPYYDLNPSYGPLFKMKRIGRYGNPIYVYKFRTMHPYAEYLQDFVINLHGYSEKGKPADDFRLTAWGKVFRKYWLDELPQLINVIKGDMKLVGARPLSQRVYDDYPDDIKIIRDKYKPGCIPPYVSLLMQGMDASIEAERNYLIRKQKKPYTTDISFFLKAVYNILTNKIRSV